VSGENSTTTLGRGVEGRHDIGPRWWFVEAVQGSQGKPPLFVTVERSREVGGQAAP
jgi:hypothetical protein